MENQIDPLGVKLMTVPSNVLGKFTLKHDLHCLRGQYLMYDLTSVAYHLCGKWTLYLMRQELAEEVLACIHRINNYFAIQEG
jgi:hypothetical protein